MSSMLRPGLARATAYRISANRAVFERSSTCACFATSSTDPAAQASNPTFERSAAPQAASVFRRPKRLYDQSQIPDRFKAHHNLQTQGEGRPVSLQDRTASLLQAPIGSWTPAQSKHCVQLIRQWAAPSMDQRVGVLKGGERRYKSQHPTDEQEGVLAESVISSFSLLERLQVEYKRGPNALLAQDLLQDKLLNLVVHNWAICWEQLHPAVPASTTSKRSRSIEDAENQAKILLSYSPSSILGRLDGYQNRTNGLLTPSLATYTTIATAASSGKSNAIAVQLLDRIVSQQNSQSTSAQLQGSALPDKTSQHARHYRDPLSLDRRLYGNFIEIFAQAGGAAEAEAVLEHLYDQFVKTGSTKLMPTTREFQRVLLAWSESVGDLKYASERSQAILRRMDKLSALGGELEGVVNPDSSCYVAAMKCLSRWLSSVVSLSAGNAEKYEFVGDLAEGFLAEMQERYRNGGGSDIQPHALAYNGVLRIWSQLGEAERAERTLEAMYEDFRVNNNHRAKPRTDSFNLVLASWLNHQKDEFARGNNRDPTPAVGERAEAIFRKLQDVDRSGSLLGVKPDRESWLNMMHCWAESRCKEAGDRNLAILEEIKRLEEETGESITNVVFYGAVINAYANAGNAQTAEKVLSEFHRQYHEEGNTSAKPSMRVLSIVMNAWAKSEDNRAAERAETLLREMEKLYREGVLESPPSIVSYSSVIECYAKSSMPGATERAEALLREMEQRAREGEDLKPNVVTYRNLLYGYAKKGLVKETEAVLERMFEAHKRGNIEAKPTARAMNLVLTALSMSGDPEAGTRAIAHLKKMEQLYEMQRFDHPPDVVSYTLALKCIAEADSRGGGYEAEKLIDEMEMRASKGEKFMAPNAMTYSTVIKIYGRSGSPEKAEAVLRRMYQAYHDGNENAAPNTRSFASVLQAWARSGSVSTFERALAILSWMKNLHNDGVLNDVRPNVIIYNAVLHCIAESKSNSAYQIAIDLLDEMEGLAEAGDPEMSPSVLAYNNVIRACANAADGLEAQAMVAKMYHKFENGKLSNKPDYFSWQSVVDAWCRSKDGSAPSRVAAILKRMKALQESGVLEERPSVQAYSRMLHSIAHSHHCELLIEHVEPLLNDLDALSVGGHGSATRMFDYLRIIRALCKLREDHLLERAEGLLQHMIKGENPASRTWNKNAVRAAYNELIDAWYQLHTHKGKRHARRLKHELNAMNISFD